MTEKPEIGSLDARLPPNFTPEARRRMLEIAALARDTVARMPRPASEFDEPAPVFNLHIRPR